MPLPLDPTLPRTATYADGAEVLRSRAFSVDVYHENAILLGGTLLGSDGDRHRHLKKIEGALFSAAHLAHYELKVLSAVVEDEMAAIAAQRSEDGFARADLIPLMRRMTLRISAELPNTDLISVILNDTTLEWSDDEILKETLLHMTAAAFTTATAVTHGIAELTDWLPNHPEAVEKLADPAFLRVVGMETLRLHPGRHVILRAAAESTTMPDGTAVEAGQMGLVDKFHANMDEDAHGGGGGRVGPDRSPPGGTLPHAPGFGARPDQGPRHAALALLLGALLRAGVERDPDNPPVRPASVHDRYESFPVRFTSL